MTTSVFRAFSVFLLLASAAFAQVPAGGQFLMADASPSPDATIGQPCANDPLACGKIAFVSARDGNPEIYSVNVDGTGVERLTNAPQNDDEPAWSPDGQRIAFVSARSGSDDLYVMNADGSNVVRRTFSGFSEGPAWSPDGTKIAYSTLSNGSANLWVVSPNAGGPTPTLLFEARGWDAQPAWSPDGARLALVSDWNAYDFVYDIFLINADGSGFTALTGDIFDFIDYVRPSWSPSGAKLAVDITERVGPNDYVTTLGVMNSDGSGLTPLISAVTWTTSSWSPDGQRIAFTSGSGGARDISWVMADGSAEGSIVSNGWNPSWRPASAPVADFDLSCDPSSLTVAQGGNGTSTCTVQSLNAFASAVNLSCTGLPAEVTCGYSPASVTPPANGTAASTLTISVGGATTPGTYNFQAQGVSGALTHTFNMSLTVPAVADFDLSCDPSSLTVAQGGNGTSACTVQSLNGFASAVNLSCTGLPVGVTCGYSPASVTPPANGTVGGTLTVSVGGATTPGTYNFQAQGVSGGLTRTFDMSLTVNSQSVAPFALSIDAGGNGVFQPNETVVMAPTWRNTSATAVAVTGAATNFTGPAGPTYAIIDAAADYGTIAPGGTASCGTDCYSLNVAVSNRPAAHWDATILETVMPTSTAKSWTLHIGDSFADVPPSNVFYGFIETVLHRGVTGGCAANLYCPADSVTRAQMAKFLLASQEGPGYTPPACVSPVFADVPCSHILSAWINEMDARGITSGCAVSPRRYCPDAMVTRRQMAVFLLKTREGSAYTPPPAVGVFDDVPVGAQFADWIEELADRGITTGCSLSPPLYCPDAGVTRGQMAAFLTRTFALTLYGP